MEVCFAVSFPYYVPYYGGFLNILIMEVSLISLLWRFPYYGGFLSIGQCLVHTPTVHMPPGKPSALAG